MSLQGVRSITMKGKVPIAVVYLGKRGGGTKITAQIIQDLNASESFVAITNGIRRDNELAEEYDQSKVFLFNSLFSIETLVKLLKYSLAPKKLLKDLQISSGGFCVVPMISPLGLVVEFLLRSQGVIIIRLLHDYEKHPGDVWPPSFLTRYLINHSNFLIALSNDVAVKIKVLNPNVKVEVYPHPAFDFVYAPTNIQFTHEYILFIGRIRKYKGVGNLISAFMQLEIPDLELVIAGEGNLLSGEHPRIKVINRWLTENEIAALVQNAEIVVFPYIEASQSGLLPYCVSQNKKVVVTPLPGLMEQTKLSQNVFLTKDFTVSSLGHAISLAIHSEVKVQSTQTQMPSNFAKTLLESGLFTK
jgi:glycosyltransferase involved in cell wall biosynthesis